MISSSDCVNTIHQPMGGHDTTLLDSLIGFASIVSQAVWSKSLSESNEIKAFQKKKIQRVYNVLK